MRGLSLRLLPICSGRCNFSKSIEPIILSLLVLIIRRIKLVFPDLPEYIIELDSRLIFLLAAFTALFFTTLVHLLLDDCLDLLIFYGKNELILLLNVSLAQIHNLTLKTVDGQDLSCRYFKHSFYMHDDFVEVRVILLEL